MAGDIRFQPTVHDYLAANRAWFWRATRKPRFAITMAIGAIAVGVTGAWITWDEGVPTVMLIAVGSMVVGFLLVMTLLMTLSYVVQGVSARRLFRQQRTLDREFDIAWNDTGVRFVADTSRSETPWHDYHGWYDGRRIVLLMLNDRLFQFIPHRVLSAKDLADLRRLAVWAGEARP